LVFAVKGRNSLIPANHKDELQKYITGIIQNREHKLLAINNMPDHIHIFIGLSPKMAISDLVNEIKTASSKFMKRKRWRGQFEWQEGYGAFSYSHSQIDNVIKYINNQEEHHKKRTFREEYIDLLKKFEVEYDEKYLFEWIEE